MTSDDDEDLLRMVVEHYQSSMRVLDTMLTMDPTEGRKTARNHGEEKNIKMGAKTSVSDGDSYHLHVDEPFGNDPDSVVLEMLEPRAFNVTRETFKDRVIERLAIEIPTEVMDRIAKDWVTKRKLR